MNEPEVTETVLSAWEAEVAYQKAHSATMQISCWLLDKLLAEIRRLRKLDEPSPTQPNVCVFCARRGTVTEAE